MQLNTLEDSESCGISSNLAQSFIRGEKELTAEQNMKEILVRLIDYYGNNLKVEPRYNLSIMIQYLEFASKNYVMCVFSFGEKNENSVEIQHRFTLDEFNNNAEANVDKFFDILKSNSPKKFEKLSDTKISFDCDYCESVIDFLEDMLRVMPLLKGLNISNVELDIDFMEVTLCHKSVTTINDIYQKKNYWGSIRAEDRDLYFAEYWMRLETYFPIQTKEDDLPVFFAFFDGVKDYLEPHFIENVFLKYFKKNKEKNWKICAYLMSLLGEESIKSEKVRSFIKKEKISLSYNQVGLTKDVSFSGFPILSFSDNALSTIKIENVYGNCFASDSSVKRKFIRTVLMLLKHRSVRYYTKVSKVSAFKLPNNQSGYFLKTESGYNFQQIEKILTIIIDLIQEEFKKKPFSLGLGNDFDRFKNQELLGLFQSKVHKLSLTEMLAEKLAMNNDNLIDLEASAEFKI